MNARPAPGDVVVEPTPWGGNEAEVVPESRTVMPVDGNGVVICWSAGTGATQVVNEGDLDEQGGRWALSQEVGA